MCVCGVFPAMVPERAKQPPVYRRSTRTIPVASRMQTADVRARAGASRTQPAFLQGDPLLSTEFFHISTHTDL